jgi:hypothetical protein
VALLVAGCCYIVEGRRTTTKLHLLTNDIVYFIIHPNGRYIGKTDTAETMGASVSFPLTGRTFQSESRLVSLPNGTLTKPMARECDTRLPSASKRGNLFG